MIKKTSLEAQTPTTELKTSRTRRIHPIILFGGILAACAISFIILSLFSSAFPSDVAIGTELDSDGHAVKNNEVIPTDVSEIHLGFSFFSLSNPVTLQICWFHKKQLSYCDQQSYENGYVLASLRPSLYQKDNFAAGDYFVLVYDLVVVEDHVMLGESFVVK